MLIAGLVCVCTAVVSAAFGLRALARPQTADPAGLVLRAMAPTQLAAAALLAAGGGVALARPPHGAVAVLGICAVGAVGTLAAGSWQGARYAARRRDAPRGCGGGCACSCSAG